MIKIFLFVFSAFDAFFVFDQPSAEGSRSPRRVDDEFDDDGRLDDEITDQIDDGPDSDENDPLSPQHDRKRGSAGLEALVDDEQSFAFYRDERAMSRSRISNIIKDGKLAI